MDKSVIDEIDFSFCPKCGGSFYKTSFNHLTCDTCNFSYYINPRPCNAIIITTSQNDILLAKRACDPAKGMWDLPGGFIDVGETGEQSVVREAKEELNVEVGSVRYVCSGFDRYVFQGLNYHTIGFVYTAQIVSGTLQPRDDVSELTYFSINAIPWKHLAFPVVKQVLAEYAQNHLSSFSQSKKPIQAKQ